MPYRKFVPRLNLSLSLCLCVGKVPHASSEEFACALEEYGGAGVHVERAYPQVLRCVVLCCVVLCCIVVLCCVVLCCAVLCGAVWQYCAVLSIVVCCVAKPLAVCIISTLRLVCCMILFNVLS